jgi:uncharacterized membrane protein YhhN
MLTIIFSTLALISAILDIWADDNGQRLLVYLFKPLTMIFIILIALRGSEPATPFYKYGILIGLGCSLAGDIFMMPPRKRFIKGLVSFLITHIFYIAAFLTGIELSFSFWPLLPLLFYTAVMIAILFPRLEKMKIPVIIYMLVIITMARTAIERYIQIQNAKALAALIGAVLFVISDSSLAINRFVQKYKSGQALTLSTYFAAQLLIALSV